MDMVHAGDCYNSYSDKLNVCHIPYIELTVQNGAPITCVVNLRVPP